MSPLAPLTRSSPIAAPTVVVPCEFFRTAGPSTTPTRRLPELVVISASPSTWSTVIEPCDAVSCSGPVLSRRTSPDEVFTRTSPSRPSPSTCVQEPVVSTREPVGSSTVTSTLPVGPTR